MSTPEPGIYPDVTMADYLVWPYASNSALTRMLRSPAHAKAYVEEPKPDTPALLFGRAVHVAILEPERFGDLFVSEPELDPERANPRATKAYKEAVAALEATGKDVLRAPDKEAITAMKAAALAHPKLRKVIETTGTAELSLVWDDPATGVRCKGRLDWHTPTHAGGAILDLKTTEDASPGVFERTIYRYGYHRQGALYLRAARELDLPSRHYTIAALEKQRPYGVMLYRLLDEAIQLGETQLDFALPRWAECERTGQWPGYTDDVVDIGVPKWADAQVERDLEEVTI